jgi:hypothetical protein
MLELRPTCENCNRPLVPDSVEARICSYECTFCSDCVERILYNVCPNCGGGFAPRPIRPSKNLLKNPATTKVTHKPVDAATHAEYASPIKDIAPEKR